MSAPYQYESLTDKQFHVRVLTLLPGPSTDPIKVTLEIMPLGYIEDPLDFEALSYTWGSVDDPITITISDSSGSSILPITQSLHSALTHLRHEDESRMLWIDAICINQQDIAERNSQLQYMAEIYSRCTRVLVWLGPEGDNSSIALPLMEELATKLEANWITQVLSLKSTDPSDAHFVDRAIHLPYTQTEGLALASLLRRPWFSRLWIWQEIWLANSSAILICGTKTISWSNFRSAVFVLREKIWPEKIKATRKVFLLLNQLCAMDANHSFDKMIHNTTHTQCKDPRDRIYALISLVKNWSMEFEIVPDYGMDVKEVYREAFLVFTVNSHYFTLLKSCGLERRMEGTPSWVPNWTVPNPLYGCGTSECSLGSTATFDISEDNSTLRVQGVVVATIKEVYTNDLELDMEDWVDAVRHLVKRLAGILKDNTPEEFERFFRVITKGNVFPDNYYPEDALITFMPTSKDARKLVRCLISHSNEDGEFISPLAERPTKDVSADIFSVLFGRALCTATDGTLCIAPACAKPGDIMTVLLGGSGYTVLRHCVPSIQDYEVVGAGYHDGYSRGEALLGPIPATHKAIQQIDPETSGPFLAFMEIETGKVQVEDPRLEGVEIPVGWKKLDHDEDWLYELWLDEEKDMRTFRDPRHQYATLVEIGANLRAFDLI